MNDYKYIRWFEDLGSEEVDIVGGKNASLGEMISALREESILVPAGFATTSEAYHDYIRENDIKDKLSEKLGKLKKDMSNLGKIGKSIRRLFLKGEFSDEASGEIRSAYAELSRRNDRDRKSTRLNSSHYS